MKSKTLKVKPAQAETAEAAAPIEWPRADPDALAAFDPATKVCTMNCGPHARDPRSREERLFLCTDC